MTWWTLFLSQSRWRCIPSVIDNHSANSTIHLIYTMVNDLSITMVFHTELILIKKLFLQQQFNSYPWRNLVLYTTNQKQLAKFKDVVSQLLYWIFSYGLLCVHIYLYIVNSLLLFFLLQSYLSTLWLQNSWNPVLITFWWQKTISAFITFARTCISHDAPPSPWIPQEKMIHPSVLIGFGSTHHGSGTNWWVQRYHCVYVCCKFSI